MTTWQMYWLIKLDDISTVFSIGIIGACIALLIWCFVYFINAGFNDDNTQMKYYITHIILPALVLTAIPAALIPDTKQMAAIIIVPKLVNGVAQNEKLTALPEKLITLADNWVNTLSPKSTASDKGTK